MKVGFSAISSNTFLQGQVLDDCYCLVVHASIFSITGSEKLESVEIVTTRSL